VCTARSGGNTEGTPTRARASTSGHSPSADSWDFRGFFGRRDPRSPARSASSLVVRRGRRFESVRGLKVPANRQFLLPEQTQCCRAVWRGSRSSQFAGTCRSETFQDRSEGTLRQHASPKNEVIVTSAPRVDDLERSRAVRKSQRGRFFVYTRARDETDEQALVAEPASTRPAPRWRYGLSPVSQLCQLAANASPPGVGTLCARLWQRRPRLPALS